jgi:type III restriction enzyme
LRQLNDGFSEPKSVDVYGVPFEVVPRQEEAHASHRSAEGLDAGASPCGAQASGDHVSPGGGYVFDVRQRIRLNLDEVPYLVVDPSQAPTEVTVKPAVGYRNG